MTDDVQTHLRRIAARQGIDLEALAQQSPGPLDAGAWVHDDPIGFRRDLVRQILRYEADGEFQPDRLPPLDPRVGEWVEEQKRDPQAAPWLVIYGATGSGKTSQAFNAITELAFHAAEQNKSYRWRFVSHREFSAQARSFDGDATEAVEKYKDTDLLVLDDLGAFNPTVFAVDCASRLVDHRYRRRLPTIYTTNMLNARTAAVTSYEEKHGVKIPVLADVLDERLVSRLQAGWYINLGKTDHRAGTGRVLR